MEAGTLALPFLEYDSKKESNIHNKMMPSMIGLNHKWGFTGKGVNVAVLDTGISRHPDFDGRILMFRDFVRGKQRLYDDNGHGTHVAGIVRQRRSVERAV